MLGSSGEAAVPWPMLCVAAAAVPWNAYISSFWSLLVQVSLPKDAQVAAAPGGNSSSSAAPSFRPGPLHTACNNRRLGLMAGRQTAAQRRQPLLSAVCCVLYRLRTTLLSWLP